MYMGLSYQLCWGLVEECTPKRNYISSKTNEIIILYSPTDLWVLSQKKQNTSSFQDSIFSDRLMPLGWENDSTLWGSHNFLNTSYIFQKTPHHLAKDRLLSDCFNQTCFLLTNGLNGLQYFCEEVLPELIQLSVLSLLIKKNITIITTKLTERSNYPSLCAN